MRDNLLAFLAPPLPALRFALKTVFGGLLALWLALRLGLEQPQWAFMTAFIVAQPLAGMVVQKGLARVTGTLVGALMSLSIMGLAAQAPWLFLVCLALWVGLCTAASTLLRSAWSYAFVLSGYTVMLICLPALAEPLAVFDHAVARCTEIILGIVCATTVSAIVWPQHVSGLLLQQARATWQGALRTAAAELAAEPAPREGLLQALGQIVAVDTQREHAWFEGSRGRERARAVRALSRTLLSLIRISRAAGRQRRDLDPGDAQRLAPAFEQVRQALQAPEQADLPMLRQALLERAREPGIGAGALYCLGRMVLMLDYFAKADAALEAVEQGGETEQAEGQFSAHRDLPIAALYGLRSAATLLTLSVFWLATAWTSAVSALVLATVVCCLFASRENAVQIGFGFLRGIAYAIPVAFVVGQLILPQWSGFPLLAMALGVPLFVGALGMARPALAGTSTAFALHFIVLTLPPTGYEYNVAFFINEGLGMLIGVGCAVMAFRLITLRNPLWQSRRLLEATLRDLAELTSRRLAGADTWFAGRMAERLLQLARHYPLLPEAVRQRWGDGLLGLDIGDELLHLRLCLAAARPADERLQRQALDELERALLHGPAPERAEALQAPADKLLRVLDSAPESQAQRLGRGAVRQLERSWRQWCGIAGGAHELA
ncbi:FUSC family protein [Stutzerimonas azotifigens]|uniref:FUSC family protein n=1 Tax=Stutzerimonas azotifigens TaxID=291995 RepID=UPI000480BC67|nr:FUSC family protein [Stutzerimonas azotifigens]